MKNSSRRDSRKTFSKPSKGGELNGSSKFDHIEPVQAQHLEVKVFGSFDKAMRAFRALVQKERILSLYKEKQSYEKPSDKNRRKRNEMKRKLLELEVKDNSNFKFKKKEEQDILE